MDVKKEVATGFLTSVSSNFLTTTLNGLSTIIGAVNQLQTMPSIETRKFESRRFLESETYPAETTDEYNEYYYDEPRARSGEHMFNITYTFHYALIVAIVNMVVTLAILILSCFFTQIILFASPCFSPANVIARPLPLEDADIEENHGILRFPTYEDQNIAYRLMCTATYLILLLDTTMSVVVFFGISHSIIWFILLWLNYTLITVVVKIVVGAIKVVKIAVVDHNRVLALLTAVQFFVLVAVAGFFLILVNNYLILYNKWRLG